MSCFPTLTKIIENCDRGCLKELLSTLFKCKQTAILMMAHVVKYEHGLFHGVSEIRPPLISPIELPYSKKKKDRVQRSL